MKRVVVTGMAGITSLGSDWDTIAESFAANRSGIRRMDEWDRFTELIHVWPDPSTISKCRVTGRANNCAAWAGFRGWRLAQRNRR